MMTRVGSFLIKERAMLKFMADVQKLVAAGWTLVQTTAKEVNKAHGVLELVGQLTKDGRTHAVAHPLTDWNWEPAQS